MSKYKNLLAIVFLSIAFASIFVFGILQAGAQASVGTIQGFKVPNTDSAVNAQTVTLDGQNQITTNPYSFSGIAAGNHTVSVSVPAGWTVGYTLCINATNCHNNTPTPGNSVTVNVPSGGYADLWWHYVNTAPLTGNIQGYKVDATGQQSTSPGATITVSGQSFGSSVNPYLAALPPGQHQVVSTLPQDHMSFFSFCNNCINHPPASYIPSTSVPITITAGEYIDLWWKYVPITNQTSQWTKGQTLLRNFVNLYNGHVLVEPGTPFPYKMWFFGWAASDCNVSTGLSGCDAIFYARSANGNTWEVYAGDDSSGQAKYDASMTPQLWFPVLSASNKYFDQWHVGDPSVIKVGSNYFMAFSTVGNDKDGIHPGQSGDVDGLFLGIGGAISSDGIHWNRKTAAPLLAYAGEFGAGSGEVLANGGYHRPSLLYENGKFKLWFDYFHESKLSFSMGYAELTGSADSNTFFNGAWNIIQSGNNPAILSMANPDVIHVGNTYYAYGDPAGFGDGYWWTARKIVEATSQDGINWSYSGFVDPESGCAATHIPEAYYENGKITVTYGCQIGGNPYNYRYFEMRSMAKTTSTPPPPLAGDLNGDRIINSIDFSIMNGKWLTSDAISDLNHDGTVNSLDFSILNGNWLKTY